MGVLAGSASLTLGSPWAGQRRKGPEQMWLHLLSTYWVAPWCPGGLGTPFHQERKLRHRELRAAQQPPDSLRTFHQSRWLFLG